MVNALQTPESLGLHKLVDYASLAIPHLIPQNVKIPPPEIVFQYGDITLFTKKSISLLIARAKAGKTTVAAWIIAQVIKRDIKVLWIDTEQGLYYGSRTQSWILQTAGLAMSPNLSYYDLKIYNPSERVQMIEAIIEGGAFDLIVIDGVRDLVFDINNPEEATNTATRLMRWAEIHNTHVLTILHQNKGNEHARGHLGSEMVNKAETVIKVSQNEANDIIVEPEFTRERPFEPFALARDANGLPQVIEDYTPGVSGEVKKSVLPVDIQPETHNEIIAQVFSKDQYLKYNDVVSNIKYYFQLHGIVFGNNKAGEFCTHYVMQGIIIKDNTVRGYAKYKSGLTP